jgi:hypothetical protein
MPFLAADRVWETSTTNGTGNMLLLGAVPGYRAFSSVYDNAVESYFKFHYAIVNRTGTQWEIGVGSFNFGNELVREQVLVSTLGISATPETFTDGTKDIFVTLSARMQTEAITVPGGRLTLETGVPVSSSDQTAKSTLYYTPYSGNRIDLWDGSMWRPFLFTETSLSLTLTSGKNYDVFGFINTGTDTLNLELSTAWTTDTARATALTTQDGILVKSGAGTRRYLGTLRATGTNTTEDSLRRRFVWNYYNQITRALFATETVDWTYDLAVMRQANNDATNQVEVVVGALGYAPSLLLRQLCFATAVCTLISGIGINSTTVDTARSFSSIALANSYVALYVSLCQNAPLGYTYYTWLEQKSSGTATITWYGTVSGLSGTWAC